MTRASGWQRAGLVLVGAWFGIGGICHFMLPHSFASIVPPYIPWPLAMVYLSGVLELLGATGICLPATRRWAGNGLMALTVAVTPANLHMWLHAEAYPQIPPALLLWRLPLQVLLLWVIWRSTRVPAVHSG